MSDFKKIQILSFIADLLHPDRVVKTSYFPAPKAFWERFVELGSSHLVLPAAYGAIKRKKLEKFVPRDLLFYLQEIMDLNCERNTEILKQINFLSQILKKHKIPFRSTVHQLVHS